ncbi:MAG: GNAT family N-acetyltransferase [Gammaproteobacteria bacterium]
MTPAEPGNAMLHISAWQQFIRNKRGDWEQLCREQRLPPDQWADWFQSIIAGHGIDPGTIQACAVFDADQKLTHVLPLRRQSRTLLGVSFSELEPLGNVFCMRHGMASRPGDSSPLLMLRQLSASADWSTLRIDGIVRGSTADVLWTEACESLGLRRRWFGGAEIPVLRIEGGWPEFLASKSSNFRYNIRRKRRRFEQAGKLQVSFFTRADELDRAFAAMAGIETVSWKVGAGSSLGDRPWEIRFYRELAERMASHGALLITVLSLDGRPIAYDLGLVANDSGYCLKTSFSAEHHELSPGAVLRALLMEKLVGQGVRYYDFLGKQDRWKLEWTDATERVESLIIYAPNARSWFISALHQLGELNRRLQASIRLSTRGSDGALLPGHDAAIG